jgi:hypothetical protein
MVMNSEEIEAFYKSVGIPPLDIERLRKLSPEIAQWLEYAPTTYPRMAAGDRAALDREILDIVSALRAELARLRETETQEQRRAREERRKRLVRRDKELREKMEAEAAGQTWDEDPSALPHLDENGDLIIPINAPARYRWWQGGMSTEETIDELKKFQRKNAKAGR